jgi:hypothetical protein
VEAGLIRAEALAEVRADQEAGRSTQRARER